VKLKIKGNKHPLASEHSKLELYQGSGNIRGLFTSFNLCCAQLNNSLYYSVLIVTCSLHQTVQK